jgi:hypothetical protein
MAIDGNSNCVVVGTTLPLPEPRQDTDANFLKHRVHRRRLELSNRREP